MRFGNVDCNYHIAGSVPMFTLDVRQFVCIVWVDLDIILPAFEFLIVGHCSIDFDTQSYQLYEKNISTVIL